jgi:ABC-type dipeptide/oligopeptide/nickel transport system permease component
VWKLLSVIPVLIGSSLLVFLGIRLIPGDPVDVAFQGRPTPTAEQRANMRKQLGLDLPIYEQYGRFVGNAVRGNLGYSFKSHRPVTSLIADALPNTLRLAAASFVVAVVIGIGAGVLSATFENSWIDRLSMFVAVGGVSIPSFWLGLLFIMLFSVRLGWLPVSGAGGWRYVIMPAFTLGLVTSAQLARITRASMLETLGQDFVRTARAKGLKESRVVLQHALRNAMIPVLTVMGFLIGSLLSGAFIIEATFAYPGVGSLAINAVLQRDFTVVQGIVLLLAVIYIGANMLIDRLYALIDPKIRYS